MLGPYIKPLSLNEERRDMSLKALTQLVGSAKIIATSVGTKDQLPRLFDYLFTSMDFPAVTAPLLEALSIMAQYQVLIYI